MSPRTLWRGAVSGLLCGVTSWAMLFIPWFQGLDDWMFDGCFAWRTARLPNCKIVVVKIDQPSLVFLQKPLTLASPELAMTVRYVRGRGAAAVGIDLIIPHELRDLAELREHERGDATLLPKAIHEVGKVVLARLVNAGLEPIPQWRAYSTHAADIGFVDITPDGDRFVRRQYLGNEQEMHFTVAMLAKAEPERIAWEEQRLFIDGEPVPLDNSALRINFFGPPGAVTTVSFQDVLLAARGERSLENNQFRDAYVIVGDITPGQHDVHVTPFGNGFFRNPNSSQHGLMSGPELLANILATLSDRAWIRRPWPVRPFPLLIILGVFLGMAFDQLGLVKGLIASVAFHFFWKLLAIVVFQICDLRLPIAPALILGGTTYLATFAVRWHKLRRLLGIIKSDPIARALEVDPTGESLQGEERVITVLFADIRDFTTYSESHAARAVVTLLNHYFEKVVPIIERHGGVLNQYMGDGIMVLFGTPVRLKDHATAAVKCASEMVAMIKASRTDWEKLDFPNLRIGIGIHTGNVIVGTVGSAHRFDYTAIGDTINTAARIESETKNQKCAVLVSGDTFREISSSDRQGLRIDGTSTAVELKGKGRSVAVHHVDI